MGKLEIEVPEGKKAEWIDGVLRLVDDKPKSIIDRIKTIKDACNELGDDHPFVKAYRLFGNSTMGTDIAESSKDIYAYLKLRIITCALNEGWEPSFNKEEYRYYPIFKKINDDGRVLARSGYSAYADDGVSFAITGNGSAFTYADRGSQLAYKTKELAIYAGKQFIDVFKDYIFDNKIQNEKK